MDCQESKTNVGITLLHTENESVCVMGEAVSKIFTWEALGLSGALYIGDFAFSLLREPQNHTSVENYAPACHFRTKQLPGQQFKIRTSCMVQGG